MVLLGSLSGYFSTPYMALYSASKGFEIALAESLWGEFKQLNVDVLCSIIGAVDTPDLKGLYPDEDAYAAMKPADPAIVAKDTIDALGNAAIVIPEKGVRRNVGMLRKTMNLNKQVEVVGDQSIKPPTRALFPASFPKGS